MGDPTYSLRIREQFRRAVAWGGLPAVALIILARVSHNPFIGSVALLGFVAASVWVGWNAVRVAAS